MVHIMYPIVKPFAKNGAISFSPDAVTVTPLGVTNLACSLTASNTAITVQPGSMAPRAVSVTSVAVQVDGAQQTP